MGFVSGLIGTAGGAGGSGFSGPSGANIMMPTTTEQAQKSYDQAQTGLNWQGALAEEIRRQQGLQNQSNVFAQQQALANQIQGVANGTGPNPALAQFNQATGANVANQAALMAGQRGAGSNAGLIARQAAMQGGNIQQQAAGQGATMQAQQQLAAMQALQGQQQALQQAAGQQASNYIGAIGGYNSAGQGEQANLLNSIAQQNNAQVGNQSSLNNNNSALIGSNMSGQQNIIGGLTGGGGAGLVKKAHGGMVGYADGGVIPPSLSSFPGDGPQSSFGRYLQGGDSLRNGFYGLGEQLGERMRTGTGNPQGAMAGGPMDMGQPGFEPQAYAAHGGIMEARVGGKVPGKAEVAGDSAKNDKVPAVLSPGEIVIPRSVLESKDPVGNAAKFVHHVLYVEGKKK